MSELEERYSKLLSFASDTKRTKWGAKPSSEHDHKTGLTSQIVDLILEQAILERSSDVHFEPYEGRIRIRYRIDGQLYNVLTIEDALNNPIIARIKVMANLPTDTMSQRKSHDGRFSSSMAPGNFDFRVSTFPTVQGEKVAIRILNEDTGLYKVDKIGLDSHDLACIGKILQHKYGLLIVSGPTGCGKTTTLYAILNERNSPKINVVTLEDPVEYQIKGINQCDIKTKSDFNFADGLKSVLRQDPDIILVGEIRDLETAEITVRASMTGHFVFSSIHANSAVGTIVRLINMGLEPYMVSYAMIGAITQRLVRKICGHCKASYSLEEQDIKRLKMQYGIDINMLASGTTVPSESGLQYVDRGKENRNQELVFYRGKGCSSCNQTGYKGRIGIFEIVIFEQELRDAILRGASSSELQEIAVRKGTKTLARDGLEKARAGITTLDEIYSVLIEK